MIGALASSALYNALLVDALEKQALPTAAEANSRKQITWRAEDEMVGSSPSMQQLRHEITVVAGSELNVLITGETGVGKELVANAVHQLSPRADKPLVYLNCAALPESVAESELFGHVKGAFTGAIHNRTGKFEMGRQRYAILDEIGELSLVLQAKLLRVIQYGDVQRVGEDSTKRVNVRILAATNRDLKQAVVDGHFRVDLFHRLSVFPLTVPPLRERKDDIVLLAGFFVEHSKNKLGLRQLRLPADTLAMLVDYGWPGNVRELKHAIERAAVLARASHNQGDVTLYSSLFNLVPTDSRQRPVATRDEPTALTTLNFQLASQGFQRQYIAKALQENQMNWSATARVLGLDGANLHRLAKRLGMKQ
ncbi:Anaerobic nitric oxide reductase transcription regulator NorR [Sodalis praecaptivus]|nr:Anaerobic nitric oxide reductase transcription regulator NorR [Sodalis praecaptivus]